MSAISLKRIFLGLAIHNHQPLGNFPWVFEDAYQRAYLPMLEALDRHPTIKMSLHYSGCLIDWIMKEHPEFFTLLKKLLSEGQVEMMGGGYYEPVLPAIPDVDKYGQIEKMSRFLSGQFGSRPHGMWLAERVWEPSLASVLPAAGIEWTLVDDTAFKMVGKAEGDLFGYYRTDDAGHFSDIFPISKRLRYAIPWHEVGRVIEYLKENASEEGGRIAVLGDDGEKFGVWPETYEHCWEKGWMEDFFKAVEDNSEWLGTVRLGDYVQKYPPAGRIYLPCASYDEMLEWSLPAEQSHEYTELKHRLEDEGRADIARYMYSGYWRNFMVKYPEINRMHKRMLLVSEKVHRARAVSSTQSGTDFLWRAQCNCAYWHGVFGGIYLSDIRAETYSNLIRAENSADGVLLDGGRDYRYHEVDFDGDGSQEIIVQGRKFNLYISPAEGGSIIEWDLRQKAYNLLSTVSRKPEAYHKDLLIAGGQHEASAGSAIKSIHDIVRVKDVDIAKSLVYDRLPRSGLVDRFIDAGMTVEGYERNEFPEPEEFAGMPYDSSIDSTEAGFTMILSRTGRVNTGKEHLQVTLEKIVFMPRDEDRLDITFQVVNRGKHVLSTVLASEWNINLLGGGHNDGAFYSVEGRDLDDAHLDSRGVIEEVSELSMANSCLDIELGLKLERPLTVWRFPLECVCNSEGGMEKVYQASCVVILCPLHIKPGQQADFSYSWQLKQ